MTMSQENTGISDRIKKKFWCIGVINESSEIPYSGIEFNTHSTNGTKNLIVMF